MKRIHGLTVLWCFIAVIVNLIFTQQPGEAQIYKPFHQFDSPNSAGANPQSTVVQGTDGNFYGTTAGGGMGPYSGTIFRMDPAGNVVTLHGFNGFDGENPSSGLLRVGNRFYGTCRYGGRNDAGAVFSINTAGDFKLLHSFNFSDGDQPTSRLLLGRDGNLYGTTSEGDAHSVGTIFKIGSDGNFVLLHSFTFSDGAYPLAGLIQAKDGYFYGTTAYGGATKGGIAYRMDAFGNTTVLHAFNGGVTDGLNPSSELVQGRDSAFYGTTQYGGANNAGTVFRMDTMGNVIVLHSFSQAKAYYYPSALMRIGADFYGANPVDGGGIIYKIDAAGKFSILHSFTGTDGEAPSAPLSLLKDGNLYGTTWAGGQFGTGTIFKIAPNNSIGSFTSLHSFTGPEGGGPTALVLAANGNFYGTTSSGGLGLGTAYELDPTNNLTMLHFFDANLEGWPPLTFLQGSDGAFYGTTGGGNNGNRGGVYRLDATGGLTVLHIFTGPDGSNPEGLTQGSDGNLYGTTAQSGGVYKLTTSGNFTLLHTFTGPDGAWPVSAPLYLNGYLYGTTSFGGQDDDGVIYQIDGSGNETVLHSFNSSDGYAPDASLILGQDGNFYGTTSSGGTNFAGSIFKISTTGTFQTLYNFPIGGGGSHAQILQDANGELYGTTWYGPGEYGYGYVFRLDTYGNLTLLHVFNGVDGNHADRLMWRNDGKLYGFARGGSDDSGEYSSPGVIFQIDLNTPSVTDVSNQVHVHQSTLLAGYPSIYWNGYLKLTNTGKTIIPGPLEVIFSNITPGVVLVNESGAWDQSPFLTVPESLAPGAFLRVPIQFYDPYGVTINYTVKTYSGAL